MASLHPKPCKESFITASEDDLQREHTEDRNYYGMADPVPEEDGLVMKDDISPIPSLYPMEPANMSCPPLYASGRRGGVETVIESKPPPFRHTMRRQLSLLNTSTPGEAIRIGSSNSTLQANPSNLSRGSLYTVSPGLSGVALVGAESDTGEDTTMSGVTTCSDLDMMGKRDEKFLGSVLESIQKEKQEEWSSGQPQGVKDTSFSVFNSSRKLRTYTTLEDFLQQDFEKLLKDFFWIDICAPTPQTMNFMEKTFSIHPLTSEDILTEYTREKVELYGNYLFTVAEGSAKGGQTNDRWTNIYLCVFNDFILTFHAVPCMCLEFVIQEMAHPLTVLRPDWVLYLMLDEVVDEMEPIVSSCETEIGTIDEFIFYLGEKDQSDVLRRIAVARKKLAGLTRKLKPKRDIVMYLTGCGKTVPMCISKTTFLYMRDILDAIQEMMVQLDSSRELINSTQGNYLSQIGVELGLASHRGNDALNKLTVVSTIFLPLNLIAGLFGMNVLVPFQSVENLWPFYGICISMLVITIVLSIWAKWVKML